MNVCRLCANRDNIYIKVFSEDGDANNLYHKIKVCSPVIVKEEDSFPKQVCLTCLSRLDQCYEFYQICKKAQLQLKNMEKISLDNNDTKSSDEQKETKPDTTSFFFNTTTVICKKENCSEESLSPSESLSVQTTGVGSTGLDLPPSLSLSDRNFTKEQPIQNKDSPKQASPDIESNPEKNSVTKTSKKGNKKRSSSSEVKSNSKKKSKSAQSSSHNESDDKVAQRGASTSNNKTQSEADKKTTVEESASSIESAKRKSPRGEDFHKNSRRPKSTEEQSLNSDADSRNSAINQSASAPPPVSLGAPGAKGDESYAGPQKSSTSSSLSDDDRSQSSENKLVRCPHCDKEFKEDVYFQHTMLHSSKLSFHCIDCNKAFFCDAAYQQHLRKKHKSDSN